MKHVVVAAVALGCVAGRAEAQRDHGDVRADPEAGVLGIPLARHGSGTSWIADASPMRGHLVRAGGWRLILRGSLFAGYDHQAGDGGDGALVSQNWFMASAARALAGGVFEARAMASLEPLTVGDDGYPLLLQTGDMLVDRQRPHDAIMEASLRYARPIAGGVAIELYAAPVGEPAVGPVAFAHRPSSFANPLAPLGHHLEDSTHISSSVVTAALFTRDMKGELSVFHGSPDLDTPDSASARLSINPGRAFSLQGSYAYIDTAPTTSERRLSYSITHARRLAGRGSWTSTGAVGQSFPSEGRMTHAVLLETAVDLDRAGTTFLRVEQISRRGQDFGFPAAMADDELLFGSLALGHTHPIVRAAGLETALGLTGSLAYVDDTLATRYGTRTPFGLMAFVQVTPPAR